jgi:hypothetical protein
MDILKRIFLLAILATTCNSMHAMFFARMVVKVPHFKVIVANQVRIHQTCSFSGQKLEAPQMTVPSKIYRVIEPVLCYELMRRNIAIDYDSAQTLLHSFKHIKAQTESVIYKIKNKTNNVFKGKS